MNKPLHSSPAMHSGFLTDVATLRQHASRRMADGAVTEGYGADRQQVLKMLDKSLATEIVCALRYRRHFFMASSVVGEAIKSELLEHSNEELRHADQIAERIVQLGGQPDLNPHRIGERSYSAYMEGEDLEKMLTEDLIAERVAIEAYTEAIRFIGDGDPTTRRMLEGILADEEEHAEELSSMLTVLSRKRT